MQVRFSKVDVSYSARGNPAFRVEIWHDGLKKHRQIKGSERGVVKRKAELQAAEWESKWDAVKVKESTLKTKKATQKYQEDQKALAKEWTIEARANLEILERTLEHTLSIDDTVDWEQLKDSRPFPEPRPEEPMAPKEPRAPTYPHEPSRHSTEFLVRDLGFLDHLIASRRKAKEALADARYEKAHDEWIRKMLGLKEQHRKMLENHARQLEELRNNSAKIATDWEKRRDAFLEAQRESHVAIDRQRERYEAREPEAIEEYCDLVLSQSTYPDWMPQEFELSYILESSTLLVSYSLPSINAVPRLREVTYIQSRDEFNEKELSDAQVRNLYDSLVYQIPLGLFMNCSSLIN